MSTDVQELMDLAAEFTNQDISLNSFQKQYPKFSNRSLTLLMQKFLDLFKQLSEKKHQKEQQSTLKRYRDSLERCPISDFFRSEEEILRKGKLAVAFIGARRCGNWPNKKLR